MLIYHFDVDFNKKKNNQFFKMILVNIIVIFNILVCPSYSFIAIFFYFRNFYLASNIQKLKLIISNILSVLVVCGVIYLFLGINEFYGIFYQFKNYFMQKDTLPNLGLIWSLIPEVKNFLFNYLIYN